MDKKNSELSGLEKVGLVACGLSAASVLAGNVPAALYALFVGTGAAILSKKENSAVRPIHPMCAKLSQSLSKS